MALRKERNESRSYALVRLYLEDVEEIERALAALGPDPYKVEFSNGEWEAETVAELAEKGEGPFSDFSMRRYGPGLLSFETYGSVTRVYVSDTEDLRLRGAFDKVDSVVSAARRPWYVRWLYSAPALALLAFATVTVAAAALASMARVARGDDGFPGWVSTASVAVLAVSAVGSWHTSRTRALRNGLVYLVPRSARPNFLQRNRDALGLLVVGGVFGALLTFLVGRLAG